MKKIITRFSFLIIIAGLAMLIGGVWGIVFTYQNVVSENIVTPSDASIPDTPVRGPFTLKSQVDIIRQHVLETTDGKTYSQMPQKITKMGSNGAPVLDTNGELVMIPNEARNIWITATTLTTALNLGILSYVFSGLVTFLGLILILFGILFKNIGKN